MPTRQLDRPFLLKHQMTWFLLAFLAATPAAAQSLPPHGGAVVVVVVPPGWSDAEAEATREAIGRELGVTAVSPADSRAQLRSGTLRIDVEPSEGSLAVSYQERPRVNKCFSITLRYVFPGGQDGFRSSFAQLTDEFSQNDWMTAETRAKLAAFSARIRAAQ